MGADESHICDPRGYWLPEQIWVALPCQVCGRVGTSSVTSIVWWTDPIVAPIAQGFLIEHPRLIGEPAEPVTYAGQPAIRLRLTDLVSNAHLTIFVDAQTLHTLTYSRS